MKHYKYGLLVYDTENIGDEIQSIAARRFLPSIDYYINRDHIDDTKIRKGDCVKVILNSWYMAKPYNWPPTNDNIYPLLISMYVERHNKDNLTDKAFLSPKSRAFIEKYGPFGARDTGTQAFLSDHGIQSYFSGCLTLTVLPDKSINRKDFILAVDVSDSIITKIKNSTNRRIIKLNTERYTKLNYDEKMRIAEFWLSLYQSAHCVVTSRLHSMLPCLAFNTPVFAIEKNDLRRFGGLIELTNHYSEESFLKNKLNFEKPPQNPKSFRAIRDDLIRHCKDFTGYDSEQSYLNGRNYNELITDSDFLSGINKIAEMSYVLEKTRNADIENIDRLEKLVTELSRKNEELEFKMNNPGIKKSIQLTFNAIKRRLEKH